MRPNWHLPKLASETEIVEGYQEINFKWTGVNGWSRNEKARQGALYSLNEINRMIEEERLSRVNINEG